MSRVGKGGEAPVLPAERGLGGPALSAAQSLAVVAVGTTDSVSCSVVSNVRRVTARD